MAIGLSSSMLSLSYLLAVTSKQVIGALFIAIFSEFTSVSRDLMLVPKLLVPSFVMYQSHKHLRQSLKGPYRALYLWHLVQSNQLISAPA